MTAAKRSAKSADVDPASGEVIDAKSQAQAETETPQPQAEPETRAEVPSLSPIELIGTSSLNITQRMLAIMAELDHISKGGQVSYGDRYEYVRHDDVMRALQPLLVKHGVYMGSTTVEHELEDFPETKSGVARYRTKLLIHVSFLNADDPQQTLSTEVWGYGVDESDKGPGKAFSYALKTAIQKMLCLPAGEADNEETDNSADEQARQQQRQRQQRPQQQQQRSQPQQRPQQQQQRSQPQQRPQQQPTPQQAQQPGPSGHLPPTPGLAQFWAAARGAKVPADLVRLWFARNLGLTTTKDATPEQLVSARDWAMSVGAMTTTLFDITAQLGMEPNGVLDIAHQMFPTPPNAGFLQLGELTQKEFNELLGWARAKLEATVAQQQAEAPPTSDAAPPATPTGDDDIPF